MPTTKFTLNVPSIGYQKTISLKVLKPFRVIIKPKKEYIKNLIVGFDQIPSKSIVESNYEELKEEYMMGLTQKDFLQSDVEYIPNWISMRTGTKNKVTLDLDWKPDDWWIFNKSAEERSEDYDSICFEAHEDFKIEPLNLKDENGELVHKVTITCLKNNNTATTLKIVANNKIVGAINVFYPKPKKVKIEWAVVEFNIGEIDFLNNNYKSEILEEYFRKAFHTSLIDIEILNKIPHEINISNLKQKELDDKIKKEKLIKGYLNNIYKLMQEKDQIICSREENNKFAIYLYSIGRILNNQLNIPIERKIILYLTKLKCFISGENNEYTNGFTPRESGVSVMALGNDMIFPPTEIPHEVMHAITLDHTFETGINRNFKIKKGTTSNYMDYRRGSNKNTYKWQWERLYNSKYTYEK